LNNSFENKILVICNELQSLDNATHVNIDCFKNLIIYNTYTIESKFVNARTINKLANFIFDSNNYLPLKIENGNRRYVIFKTNDVYKNKFEYFYSLNKTFTTEFYHMLYNYLIN
jgi:hypothetical protein